MEVINLTSEELKNLEIFNKGGFEGKIYIYNDYLLIKAFELYLRWVPNFEYKKYKLIRLHKKNIDNKILIHPKKLINVDNEFRGYTMLKINEGRTLNNFYDFKLLVLLYQKLFQKLEIIHANNIIVGDLKHANIVVEGDEPTFIDVDSMGVDEYKKDHKKFYLNIASTIPNIKKKDKYNDETEIDKLKLLACFIHSINQNEGNIYKKLMSSKLSTPFKKEIKRIFKTNRRIKISKSIHTLFEEEIRKINR